MSDQQIPFVPVAAPTPAAPAKMPKTLAAALLRAQGSIRDPERNAQNDHLRNYYATLDEVLRVVRDPLREQGLLLTQRVETVAEQRVRSLRSVSKYHVMPEERNGRVVKPGRDVEETREVHGGIVHQLTTMLIHPESGEDYSMTTVLSPATDSPQDVASAVTYYRRAHIKVLCALAEVDDDGELAAAASDEQRTRAKASPAKPAPTTKVVRRAAAAATPAEPAAPAAAPVDGEQTDATVATTVVRAAAPYEPPTAMVFAAWIHEARDIDSLQKLMRMPKDHLSATERAQLRAQLEKKKRDLTEDF